MEVPFEYWNKLADQTIVISSLLGGFSIAVIANILVSDLNSRIAKSVMAASTLAAGSFLVTVFAMTRVLMMTTEGYPTVVEAEDLFTPRSIGVTSFFLGICALVTVISLAGWVKSKRMGWFTTVAGIITFILVLMMID